MTEEKVEIKQGECSCNNNGCNGSCRGYYEKIEYTWKEYLCFVLAFGLLFLGILYFKSVDKEFEEKQRTNTTQVQMEKT